MRSMGIIGHLAMAGAALLGMDNRAFTVRDSDEPRVGRSNRRQRAYVPYNGIPQSKESKKFHLGRAAAKRARKGAINRGRVICGEMQAVSFTQSDLSSFMEDNVTASMTDDGVSNDQIDAAFNNKTVDVILTANEMSKPEFYAWCKEKGVKVTTKMTKQELVWAAQAAGVSAV
jgi:hypothetical protein